MVQTPSDIAVRERATAEIRRMVFAALGQKAARVFLVGSGARGDWRPGSDVDVAIEPLEPIPDAVFADLRNALEESNIPFRVDILDLRRVEPNVLASIREHAVPWTG